MSNEEIEEIRDQMEKCPWCEHPLGDGAVCSRYIGTTVYCDGRCGYISDWLELKRRNEL